MLVNGALAHFVGAATDATLQLVTGGVGVLNAGTTVVELTNTEANANALAGFLHGVGGNITFAGSRA